MSGAVNVNFPFTVSAVFGKGCTSQCTDILAFTNYVSSSYAFSNKYTGITCWKSLLAIYIPPSSIVSDTKICSTKM